MKWILTLLVLSGFSLLVLIGFQLIEASLSSSISKNEDPSLVSSDLHRFFGATSFGISTAMAATDVSMDVATAQATLSISEQENISKQFSTPNFMLQKEFPQSNISSQDILNDRYNRIQESFHVPESLQPRVAFWFDIYTKYSSRYHIIHHSSRPWIIYKVVDVAPIFLGPGHKWTRYHKARNFVKQEKQNVVSLLRRLAKKNSYKNLTEDEKKVFDALAEVPGNRKAVFLSAANDVREQLGQKDFFKSALVSSSKYLSQMEEVFAERNIPIELTRIPFVESSFQLEAESKVGASGIWQFMRNVGKSYLKISNNVDERNSPLKATEAAAKLLSLNFRILKSWPLAVTAYNFGVGGMQKAVHSTKSRDLGTIIDRYKSKSFQVASPNFFASYLAALHAERYQEEIFGSVQKHSPLRSEEFRLTKSVRAKTVIELSGLTSEQFKLYNPDLSPNVVHSNGILPKGYDLHLPPEAAEVLKNQRAALEQSSAKEKVGPAKKVKKSLRVQAPKKKSIRYVRIDFTGNTKNLASSSDLVKIKKKRL